MNLNKITLSMLAVLGATSLMPTQAYAEDDQAEQEIEVIAVKGIRGSMIRSTDMKRDARGILDAISAEEMGKFPDTNLAESLGRITGVSISRSNGEGSQITVRGFGPNFNLVTLNGRQLPGTGFSRSFSFENLSSEGVSALEIQKSARAETPTGGLGATVNIVSTKPLADPGTKMSLMAKGLMDESNVEGEDITPEFAGVFSTTLFDDRFGVAVNFSHHRRDFQKQQASIQGWQYGERVGGVALGIGDLPSTLAPENVIDNRAIDENGYRVGAHYFPKDMNYGVENVQRERNNGQVTLQFEPIDDFRLTADYTVSQATTGTNSFGWGIWNNFGSNITAYELDENGTAVYAEIVGDDGSFTASRNTTEVKSESFGINLDWQITENLSVEVDYHDSSSETDNGADSGLGGAGQIILGSDQLESKIYDFRTGEIPNYVVNWDNGSNELMASEIDSNFSQFLHNPGESSVEQTQLHFTYVTDFEHLGEVKFGATQTVQSFSGINGWSGLRGGPGFNPSYTEIFPDEMFVRQDTGGMLDQFEGGGEALSPNYYYTFDFDEAISRQLAVLNQGLLGESNYYTTNPYALQKLNSSLEETTSSIYLQTEWDFEIADMPLIMNVGVRYESSDIESPYELLTPVKVNWVTPSEWITTYADEVEQAQSEGSYEVILPMIDFKLDVTDDFVTRLSIGQTMTRPNIGDILGGESYSGSPKIGARTGSRGNTGLKPYLSTNLDVSFEYYYDEGSSVTLGLFVKEVEDWIANSNIDVTVDGVYDVYLGERWNEAITQIEQRGEVASDSNIFQQLLVNGHGVDGQIEGDSETDSLLVWTLATKENVDTRSVHGLEFAIQHLFGDSGFGFATNFTLVDGDVDYDPEDTSGTQKVLEGISNSANFQAFYEDDDLSIKTTYSWRDSYLIGLGQAQGTTTDQPPQYAKEFGQWDVSINYNVSENVTVFLEGVNLNNETEYGYGRYEEQFLFARQYGTRYALGGRIKF
jgi:TonB-dependent receptor